MQAHPLKRIAATVMAFIFLLGCFPAYATPADANDGQFTLESESDAVQVGDEVKVLLSLKNHPGVAAFECNVVYNHDALELTDVVAKDLEAVQFSSSKEKCVWYDSKQQNRTGDFAICEWTFKVQESAVEKPEISLLYASGDIYRTEGQQTINVNPKVVAKVLTIAHKVSVTNGSTLDAPAGNLYASGATVKIKADDAPYGKIFGGWKASNEAVQFADANAPETSFAMIAADVTVEAQLNDDVTPRLVTVTGGALVNPPADSLYKFGDTVSVKADAPAYGQVFNGWKSNNERVQFADASALETTFSMIADAVTVEAQFISDPKTRLVTVTGGALVNPPEGNLYKFGDTVSLKANDLDYGQVFTGWTCENERVQFADASKSETTFSMIADAVTVAANFADDSTPRLVTVTGGSFVNPPEGNLYKFKDTVSLKADAPPEGERFAGWTCANERVQFADANAPETSFPMIAEEVTVTANFVPIAHKVTVSGGSLIDAPADNMYAPGETVKIKADNPPEGQRFTGWTCDKESAQFADASAPETSFSMIEDDVTVTAGFEVIKYQVTVSGGSLADGPEDGRYAPGETVKVKAPILSDDLSFMKWTWTGPDSLTFLTGSENSPEVSFQMPGGEVSLTANYEGNCYVATAVYGSYDCPEVWTLRRFRDRVLAQTWYGRLFIRLYYAVSPTAVRLFGGADWFQNFWRGQLDRMVAGLQNDGFESTPYRDQPW